MSFLDKDLAILRKKALEKEYAHLNKEQQEAVFTINGPLLILAGAGSGKTTVVVNRILNIIRFGNAYNLDEFICSEDKKDKLKEDLQNFINSDNKHMSEDLASLIAVNKAYANKILAITFTNKAASELKERINKILPESSVFASTFHSMCLRFLKIYAEKLNFSKDFAIYDSSDQERLIKEILKDLSLTETFKPKNVLKFISRAKNNLKTPDDTIEFTSTKTDKKYLTEIYSIYQERLKKGNAMDFDDLLFNMFRLLQTQKEVREKIQDMFSYIHVDEYQDTNILQFELIKLMVSKDCNLCVVGDDDQSIYKFRGATIENILNFEKSFKNAKVIKLERNYRSTKTILDAANAVIMNNDKRKGKNLWTKGNDGKKIDFYRVSSTYEECDSIINAINDGILQGRKYNDFAILYRTNAMSRSLEKAFFGAKIPHKIIGSLRFLERKEVKDILSYLSLIVNSNDDLRFNRIINIPKRGLGNKTLDKIAEISKNHDISLYESVELIVKSKDDKKVKKDSKDMTFFDIAETKNDDKNALYKEFTPTIYASLKNFYDIIEKSKNMLENESLSKVFEFLIDSIKYEDYIKEEDDKTQERIDNVNELLNTIVSFEKMNKNGTLAQFLEEMALLSDTDELALDENYVSLMTVHSSKGLEFPIVFIAGFDEGIFPIETEEDEELEEERRLCYVAITRAKEELSLFSAHNRMHLGKEKDYASSRFLDEIPESLLEHKSSKNANSEAFSSFNPRFYKKPINSFSSSNKSLLADKTSNKISPISINLSSINKVDTHTKFSVGDNVLHKKFGEGKVISVTKTANDQMLEISFNDVGNKKIMANFAKLEKL